MKSPKSFLFVTIDGGGNVPPMMGIAKELIRRGHDVATLTEPCMAKVVRHSGADYRPFETYFTRTNSSVDLFQDTLPGADELTSMEKVILGPSKITFSETLRAIDDGNPDVVVADVLLPAALMAAELRDIPGVVIFHMPEYLPGPNRPPGMLGLTPGRTVLGRLRDRLLGKLWNKKLNKYSPLINDIRREHQLMTLNNVTDLLHQADLRLILTLESFDFPIKPTPTNVHYTGPVIDDPHWTEEWQNPWSKNDDPLVVVSMSSTFMSQVDTIHRCIEALNNMPVRGLVTTGPSLDPVQFETSEKVKVVRAVPHSAVFLHASAVITHAGHGTVMRALSNGLPLVCMPMGRDQKDNAVKVQYHGCGIRLKPTASVAAIRKAVETVLNDSSYRTAAGEWQKRIAASSGVETAAELLEKFCLSSFSDVRDQRKTTSKRHATVL